MNVVEIIDLKKSYSDGTKAVNGISISIREGEVFGFLGPNGAGKSTTMSCLIGSTRPTSGDITILGYDAQTQYEELRQYIGYVPQDLIFYAHLTVYENLKLFAECYEIPDSKARIEEIMVLLEIENLANRRSENMSGGQKRRLNLAIGLLNRPKILLLDEPSAGMDPQSRNKLWKAIEQIAGEGIAIILSTHLMETADVLSDRIAIIDHGKIIAIGTSEELKYKYGQGNSLLIRLEDVPAIELQTSLEELKIGEITISDKLIMIQTTNGISLLNKVYDLVESFDVVINEIGMRQSTLEDVFISLTGGELREADL